MHFQLFQETADCLTKMNCCKKVDIAVHVAEVQHTQLASAVCYLFVYVRGGVVVAVNFNTEFLKRRKLRPA